MAKMFYTVEETAERLGVTADQVRDMAAGGKLQQFRDRDKLMFKRDQVDALASLGKSGTGSETSIPLASSGDTDAISLADSNTDSRAGNPPRKEDPRQATGVSVFDQDEVEHADPMAQTQVTTPVADQEQLALESVGSGSGLLDLTRESDDTSLGAELLDEIYPGGTEAGGAGATKEASVPGSSGVFEGAMQAESGASGLENLQQAPTGDTLVTVGSSGPAEVYDPAGDWMSGLALAGATIALFAGLIIAMSAATGVPSALATQMGSSAGTLMMYMGIGLAVVLILALVGFFIGRSQER